MNAGAVLQPPAAWRRESAEVYYAAGPLVHAGLCEVAVLKELARRNPRLRCRLCTHPAAADPFHEMLIVHHRDSYFRPHLHRARSQSFHFLEGGADVAVFSQSGAIAQTIAVAAGVAEAPCYLRIPADTYYAFRVTSEFLAFFEVTTGPFDPTSTLWAPWSPAEGTPAAPDYARALGERIAAHGSERG